MGVEALLSNSSAPVIRCAVYLHLNPHTGGCTSSDVRSLLMSTAVYMVRHGTSGGHHERDILSPMADHHASSHQVVSCSRVTIPLVGKAL
jgi:hypothetical protein